MIILSTVLAALGQLAYLQNIGMFDVYTAHLTNDVISCAALLAGGATIKQAKIRHALLGISVPHTVYRFAPGRPESVSQCRFGGIFPQFCGLWHHCVGSYYQYQNREAVQKGIIGLLQGLLIIPLCIHALSYLIAKPSPR